MSWLTKIVNCRNRMIRVWITDPRRTRVIMGGPAIWPAKPLREGDRRIMSTISVLCFREISFLLWWARMFGNKYPQKYYLKSKTKMCKHKQWACLDVFSGMEIVIWWSLLYIYLNVFYYWSLDCVNRPSQKIKFWLYELKHNKIYKKFKTASYAKV